MFATLAARMVNSGQLFLLCYRVGMPLFYWNQSKSAGALSGAGGSRALTVLRIDKELRT